jgi:hypothetical protein
MLNLTVNKFLSSSDFEAVEDFVMPDLEHNLREIRLLEAQVRLLCN